MNHDDRPHHDSGLDHDGGLNHDGDLHHDGRHETGDPGAYRGANYENGGVPVQQRKGGAGMGIAALVVGIIALLTCWLPVAGAIVGIIAVILGVIAHSRAKKAGGAGRGMGMAGIILGVISIIVNVIVIAIVGFSLNAVFNDESGKDYTSCVKDAGSDSSKIEQCGKDFQDDVNKKVGK